MQGSSAVIASNAMPNESDRSKLDKIVTKMQETPEKFTNMQNGHVGHYLPNHQIALTETSSRALQYLQSLKPKDHVLGPLDKPVPPQPVEIARYNRALDIAQQPAVVLQHIKDGTLQRTDIADLHNMYPDLYKNMSMQLANMIQTAVSKEEPIPYKSRISMALFLGTPVDVSMQPASILAAQPKAPQGPQQQSAKGTKSLGKSNKMYNTPNQGAEVDKASRD